MHHVLTPAYGRDYTSAKAALADLVAGKDFVHACSGVCGEGGTYTSVRDHKVGDSLEVRYRRLTKITMYRVTGHEWPVAREDRRKG